MKWSKEQIQELASMAKAGQSNTELARHFDVPLKEIHAVRSRNNITRAKLTTQANPQDLNAPTMEKEAEPQATELAKIVLGVDGEAAGGSKGDHDEAQTKHN